MYKISDNIAKVQARIRKAELDYHREPGSVQLIAVSKTKSADEIRSAYDCGLNNFAENYLQEALDKMRVLQDLAITWHFIGPIQSKKTRHVAENFDWVHSIDRYKVAARLSEQRPNNLPPLKICLQVNISNESSKSGFSVAELPSIFDAVAELPQLQLRGLMAIPKKCANLTQQRKVFAQVASSLRELALTKKPKIALNTLSMGMSNDLEAAIAAGSTMVRIGTDIFGPRS